MSVIFEIAALTSYGHSEMALRANSLHTHREVQGWREKQVLSPPAQVSTGPKLIIFFSERISSDLNAQVRVFI